MTQEDLTIKMEITTGTELTVWPEFSSNYALSYWAKRTNSDSGFTWPSPYLPEPVVPASPYIPQVSFPVPTPIELSESQLEHTVDLLAKKMASIIAETLIGSLDLKQLIEEQVPAKSGRRIERI